MADDDDNDTPPASTELPIESWSEFNAKLRDDAGVDNSPLTVEKAATTRRRRDEAPTPENASERPIVRHKVSGDGPLTLNEAADSLQFSRGLKVRSDLLEAGYSEAQVDAHALSALENNQHPFHEPPPVEVKLPRDFGEDENEPLTVREAVEKKANWRADQERQKQEALAQLVGDAEAREAQQQQPEQQQPEPQQPEAPDPVQIERQQVAVERQVAEGLAQLSGVEVATFNQLDQFTRNALHAFQDIKSPQDLEALRQNNPQRFNQLQWAHEQTQKGQYRLAMLRQERQALQATRQAYEAAQLERWKKAQNAAIDAELPELRDPQTAAAFRQDVAGTLKSMGITEQHLQHHIFGPAIHSIEGQRLIADATRWRKAQERARQVRQVDISAANVTAIPRETLRRCLVGRAGGCRCEEYRLIRKKEEAEEALRIRQNEETLRAG
jgi:hypothetical protein